MSVVLGARPETELVEALELAEQRNRQYRIASLEFPPLGPSEIRDLSTGSPTRSKLSSKYRSTRMLNLASTPLPPRAERLRKCGPVASRRVHFQIQKGLCAFLKPARAPVWPSKPRPDCIMRSAAATL